MKIYLSVFLIFYLNRSAVCSDLYWDTSREFPFVPPLDIKEECSFNIDILSEFRYALADFSTKIYKSVATESNGHFNLSPLSMWLCLAAIAEGSAGDAKQELFQLLNLPEDKCMRQQLYAIANSREYPNNNVTMYKKRLLVLDENISLNRQWEYFVRNNRLIDITVAPLSRNSEESVGTIRKMTFMKLPNIDLNGNSVILDTFDYKFVLTTDIADARVKVVPFYDNFDEEIGTINMVKMKKRVKVAYLPDLKVKVLELSDSYNSRYRLWYGITHGNDSSIEETIENFKSDIAFKILKNFRFSKIPLEIGIPLYSATTELDLKTILKNLGVNTLWDDVWATRNISNPPAFPSTFVQRVTLTFERLAVRSAIRETSNFVPAIDDVRDEDTGLDIAIGQDFIVNKPFMVGLFDSETYTCIFASTFSKLNTM